MAGRLLGAVIIAVLIAAVAIISPKIAAGGLLYPSRHSVRGVVPPGCENRDFEGDGVSLRGWHCGAIGKRRGTIVYLHGVADNRGSSVVAIQRFVPRGFDVVAYDSRRHGESPGDVCTYGFVEKRDLRRVIDGLPEGPVVLIGSSLGAAVALQEAGADPRVAAVVAAEPFSDLRTVATERAPWFLPPPIVRQAFIVAEQRGRFLVDAVSPAQAARTISAPVLLIHGADDKETSPAHSQRIYDALAGPRRLMLVPGAGHNQSLYGPGVWGEVERWIEEALELRERRFARLRGPRPLSTSAPQARVGGANGFQKRSNGENEGERRVFSADYSEWRAGPAGRLEGGGKTTNRKPENVAGLAYGWWSYHRPRARSAPATVPRRHWAVAILRLPPFSPLLRF